MKQSFNQAYLENGTYEQIVRHLEREMELNGLESEDTCVNDSSENQLKDTRRQQKTSTPKKKQQTQKTVPNNL